MNQERSCQEYSFSTQKLICLWGLISTKEITNFFKDKTQFNLHFPQITVFTRNNVSRILSQRSGDYFIDTAVSMNETSSTPKGTQCWVVCVLKDVFGNLSISSYLKQLNMGRQCLVTRGTSYSRLMLLYSVRQTFSKFGGFRPAHFESVVENVEHWCLIPVSFGVGKEFKFKWTYKCDRKTRFTWRYSVRLGCWSGRSMPG